MDKAIAQRLEKLKAERQRLLGIDINAGAFSAAMMLSRQCIDFIDELITNQKSVETDDEEVDKILTELLPILPNGFPAGENKKLLLRLAECATTYRQQLRDAQAEIERLKKCDYPIDFNKRGEIESAICGAVRDTINAHGPITIDNAPSCSKRVVGLLKSMNKRLVLGEIKSLQSQITTITTERDEARKDIERMKQEQASGIMEGDPRVCSHGFVELTLGELDYLKDRFPGLTEAIEEFKVCLNDEPGKGTLAEQIATLTAELTTLKSCPEMEEVDVLEKEWRQSINHTDRILAALRQAIASNTAERQKTEDISKDHSNLIEQVLKSVKLGSSREPKDMIQALRDCEAFAMSANIDQLFRGVVCQFGLVQQGHIPTIEKMLQEGAAWEDIGLKIGWCHKTAEEHYKAYLIGKGTK